MADAVSSEDAARRASVLAAERKIDGRRQPKALLKVDCFSVQPRAGPPARIKCVRADHNQRSHRVYV